MIDGGTGLDEDDYGSGSLEREHEIAWGVLADEGEVAFLLGSLYGFVDFGGGSVVDGDGEAFLGDVEGEILAHHS